MSFKFLTYISPISSEEKSLLIYYRRTNRVDFSIHVSVDLSCGQDYLENDYPDKYGHSNDHLRLNFSSVSIHPKKIKELACNIEENLTIISRISD